MGRMNGGLNDFACAPKSWQRTIHGRSKCRCTWIVDIVTPHRIAFNIHTDMVIEQYAARPAQHSTVALEPHAWPFAAHTARCSAAQTISSDHLFAAECAASCSARVRCVACRSVAMLGSAACKIERSVWPSLAIALHMSLYNKYEKIRATGAGEGTSLL